eukprot:COSAG01_NODE_46293_length_401_cov_1.029801_2_plen_42_part_01
MYDQKNHTRRHGQDGLSRAHHFLVYERQVERDDRVSQPTAVA